MCKNPSQIMTNCKMCSWKTNTSLYVLSQYSYISFSIVIILCFWFSWDSHPYLLDPRGRLIKQNVHLWSFTNDTKISRSHVTRNRIPHVPSGSIHVKQMFTAGQFDLGIKAKHNSHNQIFWIRKQNNIL